MKKLFFNKKEKQKIKKNLKIMFANNPNYKLISCVDRIYIEGDKMVEVFESEKLSKDGTHFDKDERRYISKIPVEFKRVKEDYEILNGIKSQFLMKFADSFIYLDDNYFYTIVLHEARLFCYLFKLINVHLI